MLKPYIFLEARLLLPGSGAKVFRLEHSRAGNVDRALVDSESANQACMLIRALEGQVLFESPFEWNRTSPSLPPGLDLTRLSLRLGEKGGVEVNFHRRKKRITITDFRLEEDFGRLVRDRPLHKNAYMDYSTAGMPSIRFRTGTDFEIGEEAAAFLTEVMSRIRYMGLCPPGMDMNIRCNAYAALVNYPQKPEHYVKLRNLNSFNFVSKAVNAEIARQERIISGGGMVAPESRIWNEAKTASESFQARPGSLDTRFEASHFPPFVPGLNWSAPGLEQSQELPSERRKRFIEQYNLSEALAGFVCADKNRADYFEDSLKAGAEAAEAAGWMASFAVKEADKPDSIPGSLSPERFAHILGMLKTKRLNAVLARQVMSAVLSENREPEDIVREQGWEQINDKNLIAETVRRIIEANPNEVRRIREGEAGPLQFLTSEVMKKTEGKADPSLVKELLNEQLSVSLVYVLGMGGAVSGRITEDGAMEPGDETGLRNLMKVVLARSENDSAQVRFEHVQVGRILSEEIIPSDWAALITAIGDKIASGTANGIVITHGIDTLPYTAPLLYYLFADAGTPIVLASSSTPPGTPPEEESEAVKTMRCAVNLAIEKSGGVYVANGGEVLSPLNLKFEKIGRGGFRNWNMDKPIFSGSSLLNGFLDTDPYVLHQLVEDAVNSLFVVKLYPGIRADHLLALMDRGVKNFFLELYDTGTAGFREGAYNFKRVLSYGKRMGVRFYCTSQQEGIVDFSLYATAKVLWKEGAVPMGLRTTETAVARFVAASIIADDEAERAFLMEN